MNYKRKDSVPLSLRMDREIFDKLELFCEEAGQSKTIAIERAVEMYILDYEAKQAIIRNSTK